MTFRVPTSLAVLGLFAATAPAFADLAVSPGSVTLTGKGDRQRLIVTETAAGRARDRTREATFSAGPAGVVSISPEGVVTPVGDGTATITAKVGSQAATATVKVIGGSTPRAPTFERDIEPILARAGCNAGACHGKARGQNGCS